MLPTRHQFILCQALDYSRNIASTTVVNSEADCDELTDVGHLCEQHAADLLGVKVLSSGIEDAGLGLFTTRSRRRGDYICEYLGRIVSSAQFEIQPDEYSVDISGGRVLSARCSTDGFGRYANDARSSRDNNCLLMTEATYVREYANGNRMRLRGSEDRVCLVAKGDLEAGVELFVDYGREYWRRRGQ